LEAAELKPPLFFILKSLVLLAPRKPLTGEPLITRICKAKASLDQWEKDIVPPL